MKWRLVLVRNEGRAHFCFPFPVGHVFCEIMCAREIAFKFVLYFNVHCMWPLSSCCYGGKVQCEVLGCLADTFFLIVFKASTTGGAGCRTCQTGDHGRVECHHRGTWPTRSTSYSVYNQLSFLINLMA